MRSLAIYHHPASLMRWRRFYREVLAPGSLAFDIGAHVGSRARAMRAAGARVVALEPQQPFAEFLRLTLPRDIVVLPVAAGSAEVVAEMSVSSRHPTVSSLRTEFVEAAGAAPGFEHVRWDRRQPVKVTTLDALIARFGRPDYIKIDVEGYEVEVLSGLSEPVSMVSVEYLPAFPQMASRVVGKLAEIGPYAFNAVEGEAGEFLWPEWQNTRSIGAWLGQLPRGAKSGDIFARLT